MKIKDCFFLKEIAGIYTVISVNGDSDFDGMLTLNHTGAFLWSLLVTGASKQELIEALVKEYEIDSLLAEKDTNDFLNKLNSIDVFE